MCSSGDEQEYNRNLYSWEESSEFQTNWSNLDTCSSHIGVCEGRLHQKKNFQKTS